MSPSLRFLALALLGWTGFRASSLGLIPGAEIFRVDRSSAATAQTPPSAIVPTEFPPIDPPAPVPTYADATYPQPGAAAPSAQPAAQGATLRGQPVVYYASSPATLLAIPASLPSPRPQFYAPIPQLDEWPLSRIAASSLPQLRHASIAVPAQSLPIGAARPAFDRVQLSAWALLRGRQGLASGPASIAPGGTLGDSQAGARLTYAVTRELAATLRTTTSIGKRGGEVAAGVRFRPLGIVPVWVNVERRQRIGRFGDGRNAFALFFEGGVYDRPMPWRFNLDAYLQAGVVGLHHRDKFIDGGLTLTRPIFKQLSGGIGLWGASQPGVYRIDAGPRLTYRVRPNIKVHLDYRQRLAGNAEPGSGPVVTLASDF